MTSSAYPSSFQDFCSSPLFLINLERRPERRVRSLQRLQEAGFTDVRVFDAVDAAKGDDYLTHEWAKHGSPRLNSYDSEFYTSYKGKQGCMLSHLAVLKHVIDNQIPYFIVFEDDTLFYKDWHTLAPTYYSETPRDYDLLYLGAWIEGDCSTNISQNACLCTNAMAMTLEGARRIYKFLLSHPYGAYTIDCMLYNYQDKRRKDPSTPFQFSWYAWNTRHFTNASKKNSGLVLQDDEFISDVRPA